MGAHWEVLLHWQLFSILPVALLWELTTHLCQCAAEQGLNKFKEKFDMILFKAVSRNFALISGTKLEEQHIVHR